MCVGNCWSCSRRLGRAPVLEDFMTGLWFNCACVPGAWYVRAVRLVLTVAHFLFPSPSPSLPLSLPLALPSFFPHYLFPPPVSLPWSSLLTPSVSSRPAPLSSAHPWTTEGTRGGDSGNARQHQRLGHIACIERNGASISHRTQRI